MTASDDTHIKSFGLKCCNVKPLAPGAIFGRWTVVELPASKPIVTRDRILCQCECGRTVPVIAESLLRGVSTQCKPCSWEKNKKDALLHGETNTKLHSVWRSMIARCHRSTSTGHLWYFDKGIAVCQEWRTDFVSFRNWSYANGYAKGLSIDRIDPLGNYEPANCRWATLLEQARNKTNTCILTAYDETKSLSEWLEDSRCSVSRQTVFKRLKAGWPSARAISEAPGRPNDLCMTQPTDQDRRNAASRADIADRFRREYHDALALTEQALGPGFVPTGRYSLVSHDEATRCRHDGGKLVAAAVCFTAGRGEERACFSEQIRAQGIIKKGQSR